MLLTLLDCGIICQGKVEKSPFVESWQIKLVKVLDYTLWHKVYHRVQDKQGSSLPNFICIIRSIEQFGKNKFENHFFICQINEICQTLQKNLSLGRRHKYKNFS